MSGSLSGSLERLDVTGVDALRGEWRTLEARCGQSFFISWGWIGPWLELVLPRVEVFVFRAQFHSDTVALGLLSRYQCKRGKILPRSVFALHEARTDGLDMVIEYNDLLGLPDHIANCRTLMLSTLLQTPYGWSELQLSGVDPAWNLALQAVAPDLYEHLSQQRSPWVASIDGVSDVGAVLGKVSRNRRSKIRQSIRHFETIYGPLRTSEPDSAKSALAAFERMGELHTARWNRAGMAGSWGNARWADFHRRVILQGFDRGEVQLLSVFAGDALLGTIYSFLWNERVYMLQSGFAEPRRNAERPGYVAHCLAMAVNGARSLKRYDFMCGDAEYKQSLAQSERSLMWTRFRRRGVWNVGEDRLLSLYRKTKTRFFRGPGSRSHVLASTALQSKDRQPAKNTPAAFILGGGLISLGIIRSLGRRGVPITVFYYGDDDIAAHSKYVRAVRLTDESNAQLAIDALVTEAKLEAEKPVLLVAGDRALLQACSHKDKLKPYLHVLLPSLDAAETVVSKELFRTFTESHGAPVPKSWLPNSSQELAELAEKLQYPVVIKPVRSTDWQTPAVVSQQGHIKMVLARDAAALISHWTFLAATCGPALVQEYIDGRDRDHYSYVSYRGVNGQELAGMCIQKLRLNPIHGGLSSLAVCVEDESMKRAAQDLLQQLGYVSAASVCFKRDTRTGKAFVFEVNGRLPLAHGALFANGVDLPWLMYCDAQGLRSDTHSMIPGRQRWISLTHDFWAVRDYSRCEELGMSDWLKSLMNVRYVVELDPNDLGIFMWFVRKSIGNLLARMKRRLRVSV